MQEETYHNKLKQKASVLNLMNERVYQKKKSFAVLLDPDKVSDTALEKTISTAIEAKVDFLFVGGSLITNGEMPDCIKAIKENCNIPVVIFPGHAMQIDANADAILFLSLISGRNPDLLIGQHVIGAPLIKEKRIEAIPTGYLLVDGGNVTTAIYMSGTAPIPNNKADIAACTALAGEMLGLKLIFMDAGSGANNSIPTKMIAEVRKQINTPLMVGGGIRDAQTAMDKCRAGADIVVVGNAIESNPSLISELSDAVHSV